MPKLSPFVVVINLGQQVKGLVGRSCRGQEQRQGKGQGARSCKGQVFEGRSYRAKNYWGEEEEELGGSLGSLPSIGRRLEEQYYYRVIGLFSLLPNTLR